jgi:hypothetical protein
MKRLFVIMITALFLAGCGAAARESGFWEHKTMYKYWDHLKFSITGYKKAQPKDAQLSKEEDWWGTNVDATK